VWASGSPHIAKALNLGGGPRFNSHGLHKPFTHNNQNRVPRGSPCLGHVAPYNSPIFFYHVSSINSTILCHVNDNSTSCHVNIMPRHLPRVSHTLPHQQLYGLYNKQIFAYLANQTERDISLIQCPFEPVRSALGS
jgi:hypothetical protein